MFNHTRGSLIPGSLMHVSIILTTGVTGVAGSPLLYSLTVGVLALAAVAIVVVFGPNRLVRLPGLLPQPRVAASRHV